MNILGINAYHGNASAAIVCDGQLIAAVEEERFNRVKYAAGFPAQAIRYCLREAGLKLEEIDHVAVPRNPYARLGTKLFYALRMPSFARGRAKVLAKFTGIREALAAAFDSDAKTIAAKFHRVEHHQAHLASAFFVSPFERAALLSADGLGDFASTMWGSGSGNRMEIADAIAFPHSLGLYYTAVTLYLGFLKFGHEYIVMGLEEVYLGMLGKLAKATGLKSICLAGGVAFNCVANGKIFDSTPFEQVYVQPAAGDGGLAVGAAYYVWCQKLGKPRSFVMNHAYWGPGFSAPEMRAAIEPRDIARDGCPLPQFPLQKLTHRAAPPI